MKNTLLFIALLILQLFVPETGFGQRAENPEKPRWIDKLTISEQETFETGKSQTNTIINGHELLPVPYCAASGGCSEHISRVQAGSINNATACSGYANYTATHQTILPLNGILWVAVTNGAPFSGDQCGIWVDWNRDSDFNDVNETITVSGTPGDGPYTANFAPPAGTTTGQVTMRVRITWTGAVSPCGTTAYGEVEDYSILLSSTTTINSWNGTFSDDWHTPANWSLGAIPASSTSVFIPAGVQQPVINNYSYCLNLFLDSGATLTHNNGLLTVSGDFDAGFGQYIMTSTAANLSFANTVDAFWWDDNQNDIYTNISSYKSTSSRLVIQNNVTCSGTVQIFGGKLEIPDGRILTITSDGNDAFYFGSMGSPFEDGTLRLLSGGVVKVTGGIRFTEKSKTEITGGAIYCGGNLRFTNLPGYDINLSNSTLIMKGAGDQYIQHETTSLFTLGNLTINKPMNTVYLANAALTINGSLNINSGTLSAYNSAAHTSSYDIKITGDWANAAFPSGFEPGNAKVIFNSGGYQFITTNENFNILQTAMNDVLFFYGSGTTVTCNVYNWISGGIELYPGATFTALDLAQQGLFGRFWVNPGAVINLYQDAIQWIDLNGHLKFNGGGTINIYGGNGDSWWAFIGNATLDMLGGVLDFKNQGITVQTSGYSLTMNLNSDAVIRTTGGLNSSRTGFTPNNGTFEFYGSYDRSISCSASNSLPNIRINKSAATDEGSDAPQSYVDLHDGSVITDGSRANNISLNSNVTVNGNVVIESGTLNLNNRTLNVGDNCTVYGTLKMNNPADQLVSGFNGFKYLEFMPGSIADISNGLISLQGILRTHNGSTFNLTTGNTIEFYGASSDGALHNDEPSATYGNIFLNKNPGGPKVQLAAGSTAPFVVNGNFTINPGNVLHILGNQLLVKGIFTDATDSQILFSGIWVSGGSLELTNALTLNGLLDIDNGSVLVHGLFNSATTSSIVINGGSLLANAILPDDWHFIGGNLTITDGLFEISNSNLLFHGMPKNISGGIIRTGRSFNSTTPDILHPSGGMVEFSLKYSSAELVCYNGNYLYDFQIIAENPDNEIYLDQPEPLHIINDFNEITGYFHSNLSDIYVGGNWYNIGGFLPNQNKVVFNGSGNQSVGGNNTFYDLENQKTSGELLFNHSVTVENNFLANNLNRIGALSFYVAGTLNLSTGNLRLNTENIADVTVNHFLMGGVLEVLGGTFTANDLVNNGIFGSFKVSGTGAVCNLYQDALQYVDLNAEILLQAGELNIYGGADDSWWTYGGPVNLQMSGGALDFKDVGVYVYDSPTHYLSTWINGGNIRTSGSFTVGNPNFAPWGGYVELYGGLSSEINTMAGNFHHLTINKSGGTDDLPLVFRNREGKTIDRTRANDVVMTGNVLVEGVLSIDHGKLNTGNPGHELVCNAAPYTGSLFIQDGGTLELEPQSKLKLSRLLRVSPLGTFISKGTLGQEVLVTKASSTRYIFNVYPLGNFSAEHTIFEYMDILGISLDHASWVEPEKAFNYCTFREGLAGEPLLYINNDQDLVCTGAIFPENTWGGSSNVMKSDDSGYMTFIGYTGAFGGSAFEDDPFDRIEWFGSIPTQTITLPAGWSGLSSYIMPSETNLDNLLAPVAANLNILQNLSGIYFPDESINTIGPWASQSAYSVKMNASVTLPFSGLPEHNKVFDLVSGWNLLPVISNTSVNTATLVSGLGADLQIIKEIAGTKVYWPAFGIYTLTQLTPGKAYFVRMNAGGILTFPNNIADNTFIQDEPIKEVATPWNTINWTAASHIIGIDFAAIAELEEGDILGVFTTTGLCVGNVLIKNINENQSLFAFADDHLTAETDGFTDGQTMIFKLFRPSTDEESDLEVVYSNDMPNNDGLFATEGISAISGLSILNTGLADDFAKGLYIYPNPTNGNVTIGGITGIEQILVLASDGSVVMRTNPNADGHQVLDLTGLPSGFYQVQIRTSDGITTRKIVKGL